MGGGGGWPDWWKNPFAVTSQGPPERRLRLAPAGQSPHLWSIEQNLTEVFSLLGSQNYELEPRFLSRCVLDPFGSVKPALFLVKQVSPVHII